MVSSSSSGDAKGLARKRNLKWAASVLRARAGISSKMAVPKRIASKRRGELRRKNDGALPQPDEAL